MEKTFLNNRLLDADAVNNLKNKAITEYTKYLQYLFKGYKKDYTKLLELINFIEIYSDVDNQKGIYEYYINYGMY